MTVYQRINTVLLLLGLLTGLTIVGMLALRVEGGTLDPPAGAPAPTDGVRGPGTPISSLPFVITQPGYYYLTRNLTGGAGQNGISISTSNVTVDLGGFLLLGGSSPGDGVLVTGGFRNITLRNGAVRSWTDGVDFDSASMSRVENVHSSSNASAGFRIGLRSSLSECNASLNSFGVAVSFGEVRDCIVTENSQLGINVGSDAFVEGNFLAGNAGISALRVVSDNNIVRANVLTAQGTLLQADLLVEGDQNALIGNVTCLVNDTGSVNSFVDQVSFAC